LKYTGTIVFVSHDRYFIDRLATRVFEIGEGKVEVFPGNYEDYLWRKQGGKPAEPTLDDVPDIPRKRGTPTNGDRDADVASRALADASPQRVEPAASEPKIKRLNPIRRKQMEERLAELEEDVARVEAAIAHCETSLQSFVSVEETQTQTKDLADRRKELERLMAEWEELSGALAEA